MRKNEQDFFIELCNFTDPDIEKIEELVSDCATPCVLGYIFFNRMQAVAYGTLKDIGLINKVNREFRNSLASAYAQNVEKNESFFACLKKLSGILINYRGKYAMLKGAVLCGLYPSGYRTSNDIDLLVRAKDVTEIGTTLSLAGFRQGNIKNGEFIPATRKEIIESKMMRGETVPYILEVNLPYMKYLEVDINFSLDYKNGDDTIVDKIISDATEYIVEDIPVMSLNRFDFFIHLCSHLYKEATTLPWVKMKRDMTLYKFADIYYLLKDFTPEAIRDLFARAKELGMGDVCAFALIWTNELFRIDNEYAIRIAREILAGRESILDEVVNPAEKKTLMYYVSDVRSRFFADNRMAFLMEV